MHVIPTHENDNQYGGRKKVGTIDYIHRVNHSFIGASIMRFLNNYYSTGTVVYGVSSISACLTFWSQFEFRDGYLN